MKTGIILKIEDRMAVVMVNGGEFTKVKAKPSWRKGDVVALQNKTRSFKVLYAVAACFLILLTGAVGGYRVYFSETSLISMDVNPSLEFSINLLGKVISVTSYNEDAEVLLNEENFKGLSYQQAIDALLESDVLQPYLENNNYLEFAVYSKTDDTAVLEYLNSRIQSITDIYPEIQVNYNSADKTTVSAAHNRHMSIGKYLAFLELQKIDPDIEADDYTLCGIGEIRSQIHQQHRNGNGQGQHGDENESENEYPYHDGGATFENGGSQSTGHGNNGDGCPESNGHQRKNQH